MVSDEATIGQLFDPVREFFPESVQLLQIDGLMVSEICGMGGVGSIRASVTWRSIMSRRFLDPSKHEGCRLTRSFARSWCIPSR